MLVFVGKGGFIPPADLLSNIVAEQRAKVVYEYLHRQIADRFVRETIDFLLNREEAHNTLFRQAFTRIEGTSSNMDWGVDENARLYFDLSTPGKFFDLKNPQPPAFKNPDPGVQQKNQPEVLSNVSGWFFYQRYKSCLFFYE